MLSDRRGSVSTPLFAHRVRGAQGVPVPAELGAELSPAQRSPAEGAMWQRRASLAWAAGGARDTMPSGAREARPTLSRAADSLYSLTRVERTNGLAGGSGTVPRMYGRSYEWPRWGEAPPVT